MSQSSPDPPVPPPGAGRRHRTWSARFGSAWRGIPQGMQGQSSFIVHLPAAVVVLVVAALTRLPILHACLLLLCIGLVLAMELVNSALEWTCRGITDQYDERVKRALDISSGAVLVAALTAAIVGSLVFLDGLFWSRGG